LGNHEHTNVRLIFLVYFECLHGSPICVIDHKNLRHVPISQYKCWGKTLAISGRRSDWNALDLIELDLIVGAVIELRRSRAFVRRHRLRVFKRDSSFEKGGDAGRPERMAADLSQPMPM
jgi:hypothetical protein